MFLVYLLMLSSCYCIVLFYYFIFTKPVTSLEKQQGVFAAKEPIQIRVTVF